MAKKPASPDDVMSASELKPVLRLVKGEGGAEVGCALALTDDKEAVILVDRKDKPKRVRANLLKAAKGAGLGVNASSLRFGRATLDPADETVLLIKVNKEPAGGQFQVSVKKRMKAAGFKDVVFTVDEGLENEGEEDVAVPGAVPGAAPAPQQTAPDDERQASAAQLRAAMEKLAPGIKAAVAANPGLRAELLAASKSFVALLQASDLSGARHSLGDVVRLLKQAGGGQPAKADGADLRKARADWTDAMEKVDAQLEKLAQGLRATDVPELTEIAEFGLNAVTNNRKTPLLAALMEVGQGTPEALAKAGPKALAAVRAFRKHIEADERVAACDGNPLGIPVTIRATLDPALAGLEAALSAQPSAR